MPSTGPAGATSQRGLWPAQVAGALLAFACSSTTIAQGNLPDPDASKTAHVVRASEPPVIDGMLDDPVWLTATVIEDFHQVNPVEFAPPDEPMRVYLLIDDDFLYVGARLYDSQPDRINARILRQNNPIGSDDRFFVQIDPFNTRRSGYLFGVNPNGVRFDGVFQNVTERQFDWDGIWHAAANIDDQGWTVEIAIPFKTLSFDPNSDTWRMNFQRAIMRTNETTGWVSRDRNQDPSIMGSVTGFSGLRQGMGLDVVPSFTLREQRQYSPSTRDLDSKPSLDIFYKLTPSLNAALTINTDFSATEVDDRQVNLTRFNLFFPEKRSFFLQDLDVFQFGRIGRSLAGNSELDNTAVSSPDRHNAQPFFSRSLGIGADGQEVPLEVGTKVSGRMGRWDIGLLAIRQDEYGDVAATNAVVARVAANVLAESSVGLIMTDGDPASNLDNRVVGADFRYLNSRLPGGRTAELEAWYQRSDSPASRGDNRAIGLGARMPNSTGLRGGASAQRVERNFDPAMGFVSRRGIDDYSFEIGHTWRPGRSPARTVFAGLDGQRIEYLDADRVQSQTLSLRALEVATHTRDQLTVRYFANREGLRNPFQISSGVVIPAGDYRFDHYRVSLDSGNHRAVSGGLAFRDGDFYDGRRTGINATVRWRPGRHFLGQLRYEYNDISLTQGEFVTRLARLQLDAAFSSTLSWVNMIQYDNISSAIGINSRLHWIPQAGREAFFVINHNMIERDEESGYRSAATDAAVRMSYTLRF